MFPKRSPLFPIFNQQFNKIKETKIYNRIGSSYDPNKFTPGQICPEYDGKQIGAEKCSLFLESCSLEPG